MGLAAAPGAVLALVLVAALVVPAGPVLAVLVAVVLGAGAALLVWVRAPGALRRALGAVAVDEDAWPRPFGLVEGLCATMGLSPPALAVVDDPAADALSIGTSPASATIVVTTGLLQHLGPVELEGVLAHELSHLRSGDVARSTIAAALALPLARVGDPGDLVHRLCGRGRELATDQRAVAVTRYPPGLRAALASMAYPAEGAGGMDPPGALAGSAAGRATRWLWTVALGPPPQGEELVGNLDVVDVRMAALDEL